MVCNNESLVWRTHYAVLHEAERDRAFAKQVTAASKRVLEFKRKSKAVKAKMDELATLATDESVRRAVRKVRALAGGSAAAAGTSSFAARPPR